MRKAIVIGASFGGMDAIRKILSEFPEDLNLPVVVVLHIGSNSITTFLDQLNSKLPFRVKEAEEKENIMPGIVYFAPPNYHLQVEKNHTFSLSTDKKVNFSRPSIDVLFETAAWTYKEELIGIILTGSNKDGAKGLETIKKFGGITIVQNPESAQAKLMPEYAVRQCSPDYILDLGDITKKVTEHLES